MGNREEYNNCMRPFISGKHEDRKRDFCIGAKICSGKASNEKEADRLCAEAAANPKPSSPRKSRKCKIDIAALVACIIGKLDGAEISQANLMPIISGCTGQKVEKTGRENFIKKCFKENSTSPFGQYDLKEAQKLRTFCTAEWKKQQVDNSEER